MIATFRFRNVILLLLFAAPALAQAGRYSSGTGSVTLPSFTWTAEQNTGLYRIGSNNIGFTINGTKRLDINASRLQISGNLDPEVSGTRNVGSNTVKWGNLFIQKTIIGDDATQVNNVMLRHVSGGEPNGVLAVTTGTESLFASVAMFRLALGQASLDTNFTPVGGAYINAIHDWTGASPTTEFDAYKFNVDMHPSGNITVPTIGLQTDLNLLGATRTYSGAYNTGIYGAGYSDATSIVSGDLIGVIGDAEHGATGTVAGVWAVSGQFCCAYDGAGGAHGTIARAGFFHATQPFKGTGTITHHDGIWIEDQTAGSTYTATTNHAIHVDEPTGSNFLVSGTDGRVTATSLQQNPNGVAKPTCNAGNRGTFWQVFGGAGVKDTVEVCAKDAGDAYAWRTIY